MRAGLLRHRITVQKPPTGRDALGEPLAGFVDVLRVRAWVRPLSATERQLADGEQGEISYEVQLRQCAALHPMDAGWRVLWHLNGRDRVLELTAPPIDVLGKTLDFKLLCREITP